MVFQHRSKTLYRSGRLAICRRDRSDRELEGGSRNFLIAGYTTCSAIFFYKYYIKTTKATALARGIAFKVGESAAFGSKVGSKKEGREGGRKWPDKSTTSHDMLDSKSYINNL